MYFTTLYKFYFYHSSIAKIKSGNTNIENGCDIMENLKKLRKQHKLSQQKLADILHISQQSIYKYENDITFPDIEILIQMADYFSTSIDYLVGYTDISHKIEPVTDSMLNETESAILDKYRTLPAHKKEIINTIINSYLED